MRNTTTVVIAAGAVLAALIVTRTPAQVEGRLYTGPDGRTWYDHPTFRNAVVPPPTDRRCCVASTGQCVLTDPITCVMAGGTPGREGEDCTFECGPGACCLADNSCTVTFDEEQCISQGGIYQGWNPSADCAAVPCQAQCPADLDGNGEVGINDFLILLQLWGPCE